ncbi:MAG: ligase-associated DNA damage response DEXH box helicase, partial [Saprospiraceae bacterium]|nr:ligase-associated DNA damage response DEXH box helicase [Saprospiraceae bacterium]
MPKPRSNKQLIEPATNWFEQKGWTPFSFQKKAWVQYLKGYSGIVNAPTGSGKTYSLLIAALLEEIHNPQKSNSGLRLIWITPIRALAKEIYLAASRAIEGMGLDWEVGIRTGDTSTADRKKQKKSPPQILITTPESIHILFVSKGYPKYFSNLRSIIVDEWHELIGSKRGVQMELALSRLQAINPDLKIWGISATIGNMEESQRVLLDGFIPSEKQVVIKSHIKKKIVIKSVLPDEIERFPWAGHLGLTMLEKVVPIIKQSKSTLIFTNTRGQCEIWYQRLLLIEPELAGIMAMHHGSISREIRDWVEDSLHTGKLKAVVCTSSLDLGVDFRPVETIIQIGSPKGVARMMQRAGRSGHQPGATSRIFFVPTHSLELLEAAAFRQAVKEQKIESRIPFVRSFDVLVQYLLTLSIGEGFQESEIFDEITRTHCFQSVSTEEWLWVLNFITTGGKLEAYDEYKKVTVLEDGTFLMTNKHLARRHRLSIGTIVGDQNLVIKYVSGKRIGTIEESFISALNPGDTFWFAGRALELVRVKGIEAHVRKTKNKKGKVPSWMGGRMSMSSEASEMIRQKIFESTQPGRKDIELKVLEPLFRLQEERSLIPGPDELLMEYFKSSEGYHLLVYPFEGRFVHEGLGALFAYRISKIKPISFTIAMNDYGFELLSDVEIPVKEAIEEGLLSTDGLSDDIQRSINEIEMAKRKFRNISSIGGLIFQGFPGKYQKEKHLRNSSSLIFSVFHDYDPTNLLYLQAYEEVRNFQLEEARMRIALE